VNYRKLSCDKCRINYSEEETERWGGKEFLDSKKQHVKDFSILVSVFFMIGLIIMCCESAFEIYSSEENLKHKYVKILLIVAIFIVYLMTYVSLVLAKTYESTNNYLVYAKITESMTAFKWLIVIGIILFGIYIYICSSLTSCIPLVVFVGTSFIVNYIVDNMYLNLMKETYVNYTVNDVNTVISQIYDQNIATPTAFSDVIYHYFHKSIKLLENRNTSLKNLSDLKNEGSLWRYVLHNDGVEMNELAKEIQKYIETAGNISIKSEDTLQYMKLLDIKNKDIKIDKQNPSDTTLENILNNLLQLRIKMYELRSNNGIYTVSNDMYIKNNSLVVILLFVLGYPVYHWAYVKRPHKTVVYTSMLIFGIVILNIMSSIVANAHG